MVIIGIPKWTANSRVLGSSTAHSLPLSGNKIGLISRLQNPPISRAPTYSTMQPLHGHSSPLSHSCFLLCIFHEQTGTRKWFYTQLLYLKRRDSMELGKNITMESDRHGFESQQDPHQAKWPEHTENFLSLSVSSINKANTICQSGLVGCEIHNGNKNFKKCVHSFSSMNVS